MKKPSKMPYVGSLSAKKPGNVEKKLIKVNLADRPDVELEKKLERFVNSQNIKYKYWSDECWYSNFFAAKV